MYQITQNPPASLETNLCEG